MSKQEHVKYTSNKYGKMFLRENPHFSLSLKLMNKSKPVLDVGCAYGFTSKILLNNGFDVKITI